MSSSTITRAIDADRLWPVYRGVFAVMPPEFLGEDGQHFAALRAGGRAALLGGATAAWRWQIIAAPPSGSSSPWRGHALVPLG